MGFMARRLFGFGLILLVGAAFALVFHILDLTILLHQHYSGWTLMILIALAGLYGVRKQLRIFPIGKSSLWAYCHYIFGFLAIIMMIIHFNYTSDRSVIEQALFFLTHFVAITGVVGWIINRLFAKRLSVLGDQVTYERIPEFVHIAKLEAEGLVKECVEKSNSTTLLDIYENHLVQYLSKPAFTWAHIFGANRLFNRVRERLYRQHRYLNKSEIEYAVRLEQVLMKKNILDAHFALQSTLKFWPVLHLPTTVAVLCLLVLHVLLVYAY